MQRRRSWIAFAVVVATALAACGGGKVVTGTNNTTTTTAGKPVYGGTLAIALDAETDGWNPTASEWSAPSYYVAQAIFDPLAAYDSAGVVEPYLAKSISHNSSYTTWTIGLRPGIKFQNGQPLNAAAVVLQLNMCKKSFLVGQSLLPMEPNGAKAVNNLTVQVKMSTPWVAFPSVLSYQPGFIAAPAQLEASTASAADNPIGTGPFKFVSWIQNSKLVVTKNPHYWQNGKPYLNQIVFNIFTDPTNRLQALQSGEIQFMYTSEATQIKSPPSNFDELLTHPQAPAFIMLNTQKAPVNNLDLRLALEYATNQQQINQTIDLGLGSPATEPYAPGSPWYVPSGYPLQPNLKKAKSYIEDYLRQTHASLPIRFNLGCTDVSIYTQAMGLIKNQWQQIGVDVNLTQTEQATYINNAVFGDYTANCWTQFGSIDPDIDSTWWLSSNARGSVTLNFARLADPTTDHYLTAARQDPNPAQRKADYGQVWKQFAQQAPYIWLPRGPEALFFAPTVHGVGQATLPGGQRAYPLSSGETEVTLSDIWLS